MRLTINNTGKILALMQGKIDGRYSLYNVRETDEFYDFEFTDNQKHIFVHFKLNRNGEWNIDTGVWTYKFSDSPRCITADWFADSDNACWALYKLLEENR